MAEALSLLCFPPALLGGTHHSFICINRSQKEGQTCSHPLRLPGPWGALWKSEDWLAQTQLLRGFYWQPRSCQCGALWAPGDSARSSSAFELQVWPVRKNQWPSIEKSARRTLDSSLPFGRAGKRSDSSWAHGFQGCAFRFWDLGFTGGETDEVQDWSLRDFPGRRGVKTPPPRAGVQVPSLVGELRSHMSHGSKTKT